MRLRLTCLVVLSTLVYSEGRAQVGASTGEIRGSVVDAQRAVIAGATVTVTDSLTGQTQSAPTNESGQFWFLSLRPSEYEVEVSKEAFQQSAKKVELTVGQILVVPFELELATAVFQMQVVDFVPMVETDRTQQATTITEQAIRNLPIDRRDYLSYSLLVPGIVDSKALVDATDFRVPQTRDSGISVFGSNGRGNSITMDGGEANDCCGGARETISQEAVQEFQVSRSNYSAALGGASGTVVNIVSKTGTNELHGSAFAFFRHQSLDAADPFARDLVDGQLTRIKPPSKRQQFGLTLGGPLRGDKTFIFGAFEGLRRDESNAVAVLTDPSIFEPTPAQEQILAGLPAGQASQLRAVLTASPETREIVESNSGVFPFQTRDYKASVRLDHVSSEANRFLFRTAFTNTDETDPNSLALVGISRGYDSDALDSNTLLSWTHLPSASIVNDLRLQFDWRRFVVRSNEPFGPELNISGFGFFNRDRLLPSTTITRYYLFADNLSIVRGSHQIQLGGQALLRDNYQNVETFLGGLFSFGALPGALISPALQTTSITALQAFNLGLPQVYQQGFGAPVVSSMIPFFGGFIQDTWRVSSRLTLDIGLRYELDDRTDPIPTDKDNLSPRFGFAWDPWGDANTTVRGGYGIYYSPTYYQVDFVSNALNEINGHRQIAQILTTIQTPGAASAANIYRTLKSQGVITHPRPSRTISEGDISQFGIEVAHDGPTPPLSVLFRNSDDFANAYSQQASFGIDHSLTRTLLFGLSYQYAHTLNITRARETNVLPAPVDPVLGIPVWSPAYFRRPLIFQDNVYESTGPAVYHAFVAELQRRFSDHVSFTMNYTFSKAIDEVTDFNADFQANDQTNLRAERSLSAFDQRHKFVAYGTFETGAGAQVPRVLSDIVFTPIVRANSARPFNLLTGFDLNQDRHSTTDRPAFAGRNTGIGPNFWTIDVRLNKRVKFAEKGQLEFIAEAFNLLNRLNYRSVNNVVGNMPSPFNVKGREDRGPSDPLGFTAAEAPRRLQFGIRLTF